MKLLTRITLSLATIISLVSIGFAQATYSESRTYIPRPKPQKKKKKSESKTPVSQIVTPSVADAPIVIPISVLDKSGNSVKNIEQKDFSVFVDGAEVPIISFDRATEAPNIILVLDTSVSAEKKSKSMREQAWTLVQAFPTATKFMLIDFNTEMKIRTQLTDNRSEIRSALEKSKNKGTGTSIYSVMSDLYRDVLPKVPGRKAIILMTDGVDTTSTTTYYDSMAEIEKDCVPIYPVYFDTFQDTQPRRLGDTELERMLQDLLVRQGRRTRFGASVEEYALGLVYINDLAVASGGRIFSSQKLEAGTKSLVDELTSNYSIVIAPQRKHLGNSRPVRVRVNRRDLAVFARASFVD
jgi:VWFA-related protein